MRTLLALFLLAAPAAAQTKKPANPEPAPKRITIDDPDEVYGTTATGLGDVVTARKKPLHPGMIQIRQDFWPEMYKLASDL